MKYLDVSVNVNQIVDQLNAIASPAVKSVLATYTRQWAIQGQVDMHVAVACWIAAGTLAVLGVAFIIFGFSADDEDGAAALAAFGALLFIGAIVLAGVGINNYANGYQEAANPSYYAVHQLLQDLPTK